MDPLSLTSALAAGNHAISILRGVSDSLKSLGKSEIIDQLIDAQLSMMKLLDEHQKTHGENLDLKRKVQELQGLLTLLPKVRYDYEAYWTPREDGSLEGPFSPQVWDTDRTLMRMHFKERIVFHGQISLSFVCLKFRKFSHVPLEFMKANRVWSDEQLGASRPSASAPV